MNLKRSSSLLIVAVVFVQILHIHCQSASARKTNNSRQSGDVIATGRSNARRRQHQQQQNAKQRSSNKTGWFLRRRNPPIMTGSNNNSNNNSNQHINNDPVEPVEMIKQGQENPLFPPRSDSFWRSENHQQQQHQQQQQPRQGKRQGKKKQQGDTFESKVPKVDSNGKAHTHSSKRPKTERPNIILIITDDQDVELGSMNYMPETLKEFQENGIEFRHGYVTTPMCCPSRSSILTGLYVHNHQVFTNNDNCSSIPWRQKYEKKTFAYQLHESGYYTSYIGKYLNKYDGSHIPQGWDEWNGLLMNSRFYNYTVNRNGKKYRFGNTYQYDYYPDLITNDTLEFLNRVGGIDPEPVRAEKLTTVHPGSEEQGQDASDESEGDSGDLPNNGRMKTNNNDNDDDDETVKKPKPTSPFLLVISYPTPHGPEDSAPQYSDMFFNSTPHHTPSYNFAPNSDKQWILRVTDKMTPQLRTFTNLLMTKRLQTLQSVDEAIKKIFHKLRETRLIENTYIFYTSDHGYHVGQFGLIKGKSMPYEFDIRVPFYLRVPTGLREEYSAGHSSRGIQITEPVLNIDLAPTFLDLGQLDVPSWMDGRSLLPLINHHIDPRNNKTELEWGHTFLIESSGRRELPPSSSTGGLRRRKMSKKLPPFGAAADLDLQEEDTLHGVCQMHPYPCQPRQTKYCKIDKKRIRFRKCRAGVDYEIFGVENNVTKCSCRSKRSASHTGVEVWDWDEQRVKIDQEIDELKLKMKNLREKKRKLRVEWLINRNTNQHEQEQFRRRFQFHEETHFSNTTITVPRRTDVLLPSAVEGSKRPKPGDIDSPDDDEEEDDDEEDEDEDGQTQVFHHSDEEEDDFDSPTIMTDDLLPADRRKLKGRKHRGRWRPKQKIRGKNRVFGGSGPGGRLLDDVDDEDCGCEPVYDPRLLKQLEKEDRKRRKLMSKIRKKQRFLNRIDDPRERLQAETCGTEEKMNCFWHDADHWRTPPLWTDGSFCFCMNSNNNTFTCLRSVNSTHNYLYCHFITGFKMYFNLREDPHELRNLIGSLPASAEDWMLGQLFRLKGCQGRKECWPEVSGNEERNPDLVNLEPSIWEQIFGRWKGKRKNRNGRRKQV